MTVLCVISDVPQGSDIGPIFFTMFVSDIPGDMDSLTAMFADDTKLYAALTADVNSPSLSKKI